jgi:hypothetical protein
MCIWAARKHCILQDIRHKLKIILELVSSLAHAQTYLALFPPYYLSKVNQLLFRTFGLNINN